MAEFYLHHRLSEDIDLFSFSQVNDATVDTFLKEISSPMKISTIKKDQIMSLFIYKITFDDGEMLKVDFNEYPFEQVERSDVRFGNLAIDSFYDIGINKLYTILGRLQIRDFVDLYFILQQGDFSLEQLIGRTNDKFQTTVDCVYLASQFLRVLDIPKAYPRMIKPFDPKAMVQYFLAQAKILGEKALR